MSNRQKTIKKSIGMRARLITIFIVTTTIPVILLAILAWRQSVITGEFSINTLQRVKKITAESLEKTLQDFARTEVENFTTDIASTIADFLYHRDADIRAVSLLPATKAAYSEFLNSSLKPLITQGQWVMDENDMSNTAEWMPVPKKAKIELEKIATQQTVLNFLYRSTTNNSYKQTHLFREIAFIDLKGQEITKVVTSPLMDKELKDVSKKENTFVKAENYFDFLPDLKRGEIYVSEVIGAYVPSRSIGTYNKFRAKNLGVQYNPKDEAFAARENPEGRRFQGIIRWAMPYYKEGERIGYVTFALDYSHILRLVSHLSPTDNRFVKLQDVKLGNYASILDYNGKIIAHPRHDYIAGYDPATGDIAIPLLKKSLYERWMKSGKSYVDFILNEPHRSKEENNRFAGDFMTGGVMAMDCRHARNSPDCTEWFETTKKGNSASFVFEHNGLKKLSSAASIPYYTGQFANSPRGFGLVDMKANLEDIFRPIEATNKKIENIIESTNDEIEKNILITTWSLIIITLIMTIFVILIAIWLASNLTKRITFIINGTQRYIRGERQFRFKDPAQDELGALCEAFNFLATHINQNMVDIFFITDLDSNIIYANDLAIKNMDMDFESLVNANYEKISIAGTDNVLTRYHKNLAPIIVEHPITKRYQQGGIEKFYNEKYEHIGYFITIYDVSDFVIQQQEISLQRHLLFTIFSSSPDLIWYKNASNKYLAVNPRFCSIVGKNNDEIVNQFAFNVLPKKPLLDDITHDDDAKRKKISIYSEEEYVFNDGHSEILEIVRIPIYDEKDQFKGILGVGHDMSERINNEAHLKEIQSGLEKAVLDANNANEFKSAFLDRMSHEIRTPMNAIIGMSVIAKDKLEKPKIVPTEIHTHISQIEVSAKHLLEIVNEILEISKIDTSKIKLQKEIIDINSLLTDIYAKLNDFYDSSRITINFNLPDLKNQYFRSDSLRIRQVLSTLLNNSIQQIGSARGKINLTLSQRKMDNDKVRFDFTIHDNGKPLESEAISAIESPMQINKVLLDSRIRDGNSSLSLSQYIVQCLGGKIRRESTLGGNTLVFSMILEEVKNQEIENTEEQEAKKKNDLAQLKGKRVLIVDDIEINRIILKALLANIKVEIEEANDGAVALKMFANSQIGYYDIILMDIQMPGMNGLDATKAIRKIKRPDADIVPILAITANTFEKDIQKSLDCGMNAHFSKPINREQLFMTMITLMNEKKTSSSL